ncbi:ABC transporter substrate-binding protein [Salipiger aestuarii]|uniref:TRAP-type C4-dicarboxylate transport system substrate-binding protein n=1 Tax=Salipiger aestuarii TaxID=568098 RepID=A0A327XWF2_9RHOB|nr:TRAP transporter substrate-binding protein [Salipiger aestuarii]EIE51305.1 putative extracellular solute-binding protein [Citreicella sp. 357]KAA8607835.1 ABC transporter substrate-binding protein [Salipiger aestuarii]KAB2541085.1 ABC transporter substrate-binding protein [Salipiger aestuarii]RAK13338.1 TRAP-type C4-dicarboxylate transport system substrate-binding protein [Salipiger aestuarii]
MTHLKTGLSALALLAMSGAAQAADVTLALSSWLPPRHPIVVNAIKPWAKQIEEVTEGRVSVRVLGKPLGSPPSHFDMARDGIADITYGLHSFTQDDRFSGAQLGQFSFLGDDAIGASEAFWTVYTEDLNARAEHDGTHLLGLFVHGPGLLHNNVRKIETPADLSGLKIRVPGGYVAALTEDLGATPLFMSSPEVYEKLSRGVIDGVAFTYEALTAFKLTDDIKYSMTVPGGLYNTSWFLVMDQDKWDEIPQQDQAAIDAISGAAFARLVGQAWNDADLAAEAAITDAGIDLYPAPDAVVDAVRTAAGKHERTWADSLPEGEDGAAALARLRAMTGVETLATQ